MVIQITYDTGNSVESKIYRDIIKNKHLAQYREGFYAQQSLHKAGAMWQLKGTTRILLAKFGDIETIQEEL